MEQSFEEEILEDGTNITIFIIFQIAQGIVSF